jgi:hypothetical protein
MKATMLVHPWFDRPLGIREYMRLQGFPDEWKVVVGVQEAYKLFGEAVPHTLGLRDSRTYRGVAGLRVLVDAVIKWEKEHWVPYPWRVDRTPYKVLVAEVLLQRTTRKARSTAATL